MISAIPVNRAVLSEVPKVPIAHSRTACGVWSTTVEPTAKNGELFSEIGTAHNSPTARPAPTAISPATAAGPS